VIQLLSRVNNLTTSSSQPTTPIGEGVQSTPSPGAAIGSTPSLVTVPSTSTPSPLVGSNHSSPSPNFALLPSPDNPPTHSVSRGNHSHVDELDHIPCSEEVVPSVRDRPMIQPREEG